MVARLGAAEKTQLARRAFDTVAAVLNVKDLNSLNTTVETTFKRLGFDIFVGFTHVAPGGAPNVSVLFGAHHEAWEKRYLEQDHQHHDACIGAALARSDPFYWSETRDLVEVSPRQHLVFEEAADFKLRDGLIVPMHGLDGSISSVLVAGEYVDAQDPMVRSASHMLALYFGSVGRRIVGQMERNAKAPVQLRPREIECLRWVREGKSSSDIGDILSLSPLTIDTYLKHACTRLGVRTRVQAVAEAAIRGLIDL